MDNGSDPSPAPDQGVLALETWEEPPRRRPSPSVAPVLAVEGFEGPLDWLLDLARTRRIDLARLSIVALVDAFAEALTAALATPDLRTALLGRWGDWLVMAADLTLLRSRLLAPTETAEAQDAKNAADRLRQRLLSRAEIGRAVDWLEGRDQVGRDVFGRGRADANGTVHTSRAEGSTGWTAPGNAGMATAGGDITALLRACLAAIRLPAEAGALYRIPAPPFWSVADAARQMRAMLPIFGGDGVVLEAFLPAVPPEIPDRALRCRAAVAGTFLAGLELTREGDLTVQQDAAWAAILLREAPTPGEATDRVP